MVELTDLGRVVTDVSGVRSGTEASGRAGNQTFLSFLQNPITERCAHHIDINTRYDRHILIKQVVLLEFLQETLFTPRWFCRPRMTTEEDRRGMRVAETSPVGIGSLRSHREASDDAARICLAGANVLLNECRPGVTFRTEIPRPGPWTSAALQGLRRKTRDEAGQRTREGWEVPCRTSEILFRTGPRAAPSPHLQGY